MTQELLTALYIAASVLFILSLGGLSDQEKAKKAVWYGICLLYTSPSPRDIS